MGVARGGGNGCHPGCELQSLAGPLLARDGENRRQYPALSCFKPSESLGSPSAPHPGSAWFSGEEEKKGSIEAGKLADLSALSEDYFSVPEERIKHLESVLTIVGGKVVYGSGEFAHLAPPPLPVSPDWSPVKAYGGYHHGEMDYERAA